MGMYSYPKNSTLSKITTTPEDYYNEINKSLQNDSESNKEINVENEKLAIKEGYDNPYRNDGVKFLWKKECK